MMCWGLIITLLCLLVANCWCLRPLQSRSGVAVPVTPPYFLCRFGKRPRMEMRMHSITTIFDIARSTSLHPSITGFMISLEPQATIQPYSQDPIPSWPIPLGVSLVIITLITPVITRKLQLNKNSWNNTIANEDIEKNGDSMNTGSIIGDDDPELAGLSDYEKYKRATGTDSQN